MFAKQLTRNVLLTLTLALCVAATPASKANNGAVSLEIRCTQESALIDAKNLLLAFCIAQNLTVLEFRTSMNLAVQVGEQTATFRSNGTKTVRMMAEEQDYSISGSSTLICRARDRNGNERRVQVTYTYLGDGSINLKETDAGKIVPMTLKQIKSQVVAMNLSEGEGETEVTLNLQRAG